MNMVNIDSMSVDDVWISWLDDHHGVPPSTATDLIHYSKQNAELKTLSVTEGQELIDMYQHKSKYSRRRRRKPPPPLRMRDMSRQGHCKSMDDAPSSDVSRIPTARKKYTIKPLLSETPSAESPTPILEDYGSRRSRKQHFAKKDTKHNTHKKGNESELQPPKKRSRSRSVGRSKDLFSDYVIDLSRITFKTKPKYKHTDPKAKSVSNLEHKHNTSHNHKAAPPLTDSKSMRIKHNHEGNKMEKLDKTKRTQSVVIQTDDSHHKQPQREVSRPSKSRKEEKIKRATSVLINDKKRHRHHSHRTKSSKHKHKHNTQREQDRHRHNGYSGHNGHHKHNERTEKRERHEKHNKHEKRDRHSEHNVQNINTKDDKDKRRRRTVYNLMEPENNTKKMTRRTQSVQIPHKVVLQKPTQHHSNKDSHHHRKRRKRRRRRDKRHYSSNVIRTQSETIFYEDREETPEPPPHIHETQMQFSQRSPIKPSGIEGIRVNCTLSDQSTQQRSIKVGDEVLLPAHREGIVRYVGNVHFGAGTWFGIELLNGAIGLHDGKVDNKRYFRTMGYRANRGIFVQGKDIRRKSSKHKTRHRVSSPRFGHKGLEQIMKFEAKSQIQNTLKLIDNDMFEIAATPVDNEDTFPNT
eukprot:270365_1